MADLASTTADRDGYVDVDGLHMYYAEYGDAGSPLVLLHGGMLTIDLAFSELIPTLRTRHRVVAVEAQGHGRTADIDREITPGALAGDVAGLLDELGIDRAHVLGHSMGAATTLELAISHPGRVRSVVPISLSVRRDGLHEDLTDPSRWATSTRMPTADDYAEFRAAYLRLSPHPERFDDFLAKLSASQADTGGWSDEQLARISSPTLVVIGDHDFTTTAHGAVMQDLIPGSQLAVLPGTTHMTATRRADLLLPMLARFLD